ncbi:MAG: hypothetical protein FJ106_09280 [Deltaproteobacteria bacterium]|nr:hypothetical protein [Deltaproteobacteria bacterium]
MRLTPEEKLLIAIYSKEVFEGNFIRQEKPRCCGNEIDLYNTPVNFKSIEVEEKEFTLIEPQCPRCGKRIKASAHIVG